MWTYCHWRKSSCFTFFFQIFLSWTRKYQEQCIITHSLLIVNLSALYSTNCVCQIRHVFKNVLIRSNKMQQHAGIYLLENHSTCFGCPSDPSSGVHKTGTTASGAGHSIRATTFLQSGQIWPHWRKLVAQILWPVPRLQLQFYVLLMMGAMDTRNM